MKYAVTLASGQLGSAIIKQLTALVGNENVVGFARTPSKGAHLGIEMREGDYDKAEHFATGLAGIDALIIVSGIAPPEQRIGQHRNVIEGAKKNGVQKIVYNSIVGVPGHTAFSSIIESNRQTEEDVKNSGLDWVIGRNGIYLEPDLEYIDQYVAEGGITNCAGDTPCAYTSRQELAVAYTYMLMEEKHNGAIYNLVGEPLTQTGLADLLNQQFGTDLTYHYVSPETYKKMRSEALGPFFGPIIAGIYHGIQLGHFNPPSDFEKAAGRRHKGAVEMVTW